MSPPAGSGPLAELLQVRLGSTNEPELAAIREEIVAGACNRARAAASQSCGLGVGLEDGLVPVPDASGGERFVNVGCAAPVRGELTLGVLLRSAYARDAVVCALVERMRPDLCGGEAVA